MLLLKYLEFSKGIAMNRECLSSLKLELQIKRKLNSVGGYMRIFFIILIALAMLPLIVTAQSRDANIYGGVILEDGSPIPGVSITLTLNIIIGQRKSVSNDNGNFRIRGLSPGIYNLKFELEGFKTFYQHNVSVTMGKNVTLDTMMELSTDQEEGIWSN